MILSYNINNLEKEINVSEQNKFSFGNDEVLSNKYTDPTFNQSWYNEGYKVYTIFNQSRFSLIKDNIKKTLMNTMSKEGINTESFDLEDYHNYVHTDENHLKIVSKTRDYFNNDFDSSITYLHKDFENHLRFKVTNKDPDNGKRLHIIVRIIRPFSNDFNPPHKDIYESVDKKSMSTKMINFWIPICGLTNETSLPIVPGSHLINENKILRTKAGGIINEDTYSVRLIKSWDGNNCLVRPIMHYGDVLIFSSYLIHGIGINEQKNKTRISLEFRLFKY